MAATKSRPWATVRACQSASSVASASPKRRLLATVPLNRKAFWGMSAMRPQRASRSCSRTSTPSTRTWPSVASYSRGMRLMSVLLPEPVLPTNAVISPGEARNERSWRTGCSAPGIAEVHAPELDDAALAGIVRDDRSLGVVDRRLGLEDLVEALGGHRAARDEDEQEDRGQDREQDLHEVLQEGGQVADRQLAGLDAHGPEPHDRDGRQVDERGHHRDHQGEQPADLQGRVEQVAVGDVEAGLLVAGPHEGADDPDARRASRA